MLHRSQVFGIALGWAILSGCGGGGSGGSGSGGGATSTTTSGTSMSSSTVSTGGAGGTGAGGASVGGAGVGGAGGSGGATPQCSLPADCPGMDTTCHARTCVNNLCGTSDAPLGTACNDGGGKVCDGAGSCVECNDTADCTAPDLCTSHACAPPPCMNGQIDPGETDIDCGGVCVMGGAGQCPQGGLCAAPTDCQTASCADGRCCNTACSGTCEACDLAGNEGTCRAVPDGADPASECTGADVCDGQSLCRCTDSMQNGGETDVDCGGGVCAACADGLGCLDPSDCTSGVCTGMLCAAPSCADGVKNGSESDIDCGGTCPGCPDGGVCTMGTDCDSGVCTAGACQPAVCGDGIRGGAEQCDDGTTLSFDGCSYNCLTESDHLLISEVKAQPTTDEFIEIYNPVSKVVDLANFYLADYNTYYDITSGGGNPIASDFRIRFPAGTTIAPHAFLVVSLESATSFQTTFGFYPDFDLAPADTNAPDMLGQFGASSGLTDAGEMVMLFYWDGVTPLVNDVDYMNYGNTTSGVDKTGIMAGGQTYAPDTPLASQVASGGTSYSLHRCDTAESVEPVKTGGNGITGHDETSENAALAFKATKATAPPSPKAPPPAGFCP